MANPIHYLLKISQRMDDIWWRAKARYVKYYDKMSLDDRSILVESQHGKEMNGNVFYILRHLCTSEKYRDYTVYLSARAGKVKSFRALLDSYGMEKVQITVLSSDDYFIRLATAKYLINDNTFLPFFMKKPGQVYLNTWHGTPLKSLGRGIKNDAHAIGNTQKNFVWADWLLFPNEHTRDALLKDYMLENISPGSYIMGGYPRNEAFFDTARAEQIRRDMGLEGKKVYAYMPTFRGTARSGGTAKSTNYMNYYLYELDKLLGEDEVLFLNLHPVAKKDVEFSDFKHIRNFPAEYETYDFLNAAEVLVTDYSSVFFDFACSGRKIVLFTFDKEDYLRDRGMYLSMDELPFPQVADLQGLLRELRSGKNYDDAAFTARFNRYESADAGRKLCDFVILGEDTGLEVHKVPNNGKENVLLYIGNLAGNGITASARYLMHSLDTDKRNYYYTFYTDYVGRFKDAIQTFPPEVSYFAMAGDPNTTLWDRVWRKLFKMNVLNVKTYMALQKKRVRQEFSRCTGDARFDRVVQFSGYEPDTILVFGSAPADRTIYVHNDMLQEIATRGNQRRDVLKYAYNRYDHVAVVTEDILQSTVKISHRQDNLMLARNLIGYRTILSKAEEPIVFDEFTRSSVSLQTLRQILSSGAETFINVGRFSPEKGHERLVQAFRTYCDTHPEAYLLILGGSSLNNGYDNLAETVKTLGLENNVILIERVSNPYPIIKACRHFILSSLYEGFGLVLVEADILGLTVVSTDIVGPRGFMRKYGGTLVENTEAGLLRGMNLLHDGKVPPLNVDYEAYNRQAIAEFEAIMSK